jgi:hypothetical protein
MDAISGIVSRARVRSVAAYSMVGTGRANNRIARDRVVANQIIGPRARARIDFFYFYFYGSIFYIAFYL